MVLFFSVNHASYTVQERCPGACEIAMVNADHQTDPVFPAVSGMTGMRGRRSSGRAVSLSTKHEVDILEFSSLGADLKALC